MVEASKSFNFVDPAKKPGIPRWMLELVARIHLDSNQERFPEIVHVPFEVTPEAFLPDDFRPHDDIIFFNVANTQPLRRQRVHFYQ